MEAYICTTCGVQYPPSVEPPSRCIICDEERQYINPKGQAWTTLEEMRDGKKYHNEIVCEEDGVLSLTTKPGVGIGQTAYLVQNHGYNVLWDCITYLDDETVDRVRELGGIQAIALSHPHFYSSQVEWAETFNVPVFIHEDDKQWVVRPSRHIQLWSGESLKLAEGVVIHRLGGHFKGGAVLHLADGHNGQGVLFTGDTIQVVSDTKWVSFMYSYPNLIPLPARKVAQISDYVTKLEFHRIYNAFHRVVREDAREAVRRSAKRYIDAIEGRLFST